MPGSTPRRDEQTLPPGSPGALLHRGPLRTAHATYHGTRPKQAAWVFRDALVGHVRVTLGGHDW